MSTYDIPEKDREHGKLQCLECGKIIESTSQHDFVSCGCSNETFVDGGKAYMRCGGKDLKKIKILAPIEDDEISLSIKEMQKIEESDEEF